MAGLEERLSKLESILHRLFCCDSNQFTGPQGPQGPQGEPGLQGPPGANGAVGPAGLNWQGEWSTCVVYQENDAVGYNGASYYVTCPTSDSSPCYSYEAFGTGFFEWIDCEGAIESITLNGTNTYTFCSIIPFPPTIGNLNFDPYPNPGGASCGSTACVPPNLNPCFALLANQGATGPQGPTGIGISGNDGSNSGRWKFLTTTNIVGAPGSTYFVANTLNFNTLTRIVVNFDDINSTDYKDWWTALYDFGVDYPGSLFFIQITEVGSNNIIGIYQVEYKAPSFDMTLLSNRISIGLNPMYVSNSSFTVNKDYTISWSIHGGVNKGNAPKTEGTITPIFQPGPYPALQYDYNNLNVQPVVTPGTQYFAALPVPTFIGQTLVVRVLGTFADYNGKSPGIISHNGTSIISVNFALVDAFTSPPQSCFRFTWTGTYWIAEDIAGQQTLFNNFKIVDSSYDIKETVIDPTTSFPTKAWLNANYIPSFYPQGVKVYCPSIPGGPRVFTKISEIGNDWASYPYITVT